MPLFAISWHCGHNTNAYVISDFVIKRKKTSKALYRRIRSALYLEAFSTAHLSFKEASCTSSNLASGVSEICNGESAFFTHKQNLYKVTCLIDHLKLYLNVRFHILESHFTIFCSNTDDSCFILFWHAYANFRFLKTC